MRFATISALFLLLATNAGAQQRAVYIIYNTGKVSVKSGNATAMGAIGTELHGDDLVTVGKGGSVQLSVDGKLVRYDKAAKIRVADAIKKVSGENPAVAKAAAALGVASMAPLPIPPGDDQPVDLVIIEPRATAIPAGPIHFRWLRPARAGTFRVSVKNYLGQEVFTTSTPDTTVVWSDAKLPAEVVYTWTLTDAAGHTTGSLFNRAAPATETAIATDMESIRKELGATNPALPLMLAALYGNNGCYGEAVNALNAATGIPKEHRKEVMIRARDTYRLQMNMPDDEARLLYRAN
jgi:hypothetical protein